MDSEVTDAASTRPHQEYAEGGSNLGLGRDLPAGDLEFDSAYGVMIEALSNFQDRLAEAVPDRPLLTSLTADLESWTDKLEPLVGPEAKRIFGRRSDLPGRGQTMTPRMFVTHSDARSVAGTVRFGAWYLGKNMAAHGGAVPLLFDEVLGRLAQSVEGPASRTASLRTDFRSITPIGPDLEVRGWIVSEEGRKRIVRGTLHHGDVLCAEAEGLFVMLRPGQP